MSPSCRNRPILGGSSCRLQLVDKSVELRAFSRQAGQGIARDGEKP
jgi:hypothetical protein